MPNPQVRRISRERIGIQRYAISKNHDLDVLLMFSGIEPRITEALGGLVGCARLEPREALSGGWIGAATGDSGDDSVRTETLGVL